MLKDESLGAGTSTTPCTKNAVYYTFAFQSRSDLMVAIDNGELTFSYLMSVLENLCRNGGSLKVTDIEISKGSNGLFLTADAYFTRGWCGISFCKVKGQWYLMSIEEFK